MKVVSKLGLTAEYDYLVLKNSIDSCNHKENTLFCITISPTSLRGGDFLSKVKDLINDNPVVKDKIVFMIRFATLYTKDIANNSYKSILGGLNTMAHNKGVKTWLKVVETQETDRAAKAMNIDYIQGRYLSIVQEQEKI